MPNLPGELRLPMQQCKARPKLVDGNGKGYPHCGKTCRDAARAGVPPAAPKSKLAPKPPILQVPNPGAAGMSMSTPAASIRMAATNPPNTFEGLKDRAKGCAPCFLEIPRSHPQYDKLLDLFKSDWDSPNRAPPKVLGIYSIIQSEALIVRHDQYRAHLRSKELSPRESRRWAGVKCSCQMQPQINSPCNVYGCDMCDVLNRNIFGSSDYPGAVLLSGHSNRADKLAFGGQNQRYRGRKALILSKLIESDDVVPKLTFQEAYANRDTGRGKDIVKLLSGQDGRSLPPDQLLAFNTDAVIPRYAVLYK
ncbi:hypothetical protein FA13DRAFT_1792347 [Coprinellus micaceus]|uniref:PARP catalytic domain-containing protein n=1 Tax=Coprinellus micaceus TaxID=71717 RepID=A0A4Y7T8R6_COPMI|nr:hypothetical protein FA13DRAFT_1792347 [Coprinellus micaceus]